MVNLRDSLGYRPEELGFGTSGLRAPVTAMTDLECYINTRGFLKWMEAQEGLRSGEEVYVAGDLRDSTPRIMRAVIRAITDAGYRAVNCGFIPTPALAYYAFGLKSPCIMVTGSHIPADRNGIKFFKRCGEVLKRDEAGIKACVAAVRVEVYAQVFATAAFDAHGSLRETAELPLEDDRARGGYYWRYVDVFGRHGLAGQTIVVYQHSAVGRDDLVELLRALGATVVPVCRSEVFVPIDTENVTAADRVLFRELALAYPGLLAVVSTDGDSDRPFVIDADGVFHSGDVLGAVVARWLELDFAAFPVTSSDAATALLDEVGIPWVTTKIGSPWVVDAMTEAVTRGCRAAGGWEVNGGMLTGSDLIIRDRRLLALPTRDAVLPIIAVLMAALQSDLTVAELFAGLLPRFTQSGLLDNFPVDVSKEIIAALSTDDESTRRRIERFFPGHGEVTRLETIDGLRVYFNGGLIVHLRASGNAPQLRVYSVADSQELADEIVAAALAEPDGILRRMERELSSC